VNGRNNSAIPLRPREAGELARGILESGRLAVTKHARKRMKERDLTLTDVENTIRCGAVRGKPESTVQGMFKYRFETNRMAAIVMFRSEDEMLIWTAFRFEGRDVS
jgi:hypothetical protein